MRGRIGYLFLLCLIPTACTGQYYSNAPVAEMSDPQPVVFPADADTVWLNPESSKIAWKGTKMWGRGMHTGVVPVKEGYLLFNDHRLAGGAITINMTAIGITDIPPDQPEPIRILTGHLEDEVFFDVAKYPEASFSFTDIRYFSEKELTISGNLTIKDITKNITVPATVDSSRQQFTTLFRINRFDWNIAYRGGFGATRFAARNFVDKYIELNITIAAST